jgi:rpsU-divergently transcribed protein
MAERQALLDAFLELVADRGWNGFALRDVAEAAGVGMGALFAEFPSRMALVDAFLADIDRAVLADLAPSLDPDETVRDRLFDVMMRRYDALRPRKEAVAALAQGVARDPVAALALGRAVGRAMGVVLEASGVSAEGWRGAVRRKGLMAVHVAVMRVWLNDDSPDQSRTMAALDHRLKRIERWAHAIDKAGKSVRRRRRGADAPEAPSEAPGEA